MPDNHVKTRTISYAEAVREALCEAGRRDQSVIFMAEGINDPSSVYGTTKDLIEHCGRNNVIEMPLSENALTGAAVGAALVGKRPVISFHRVEFALLAIDQIVNNAAKAHYISNGLHKVPLVIRLVVGRGWGQGPEHSQSLEAMFAGFPGLKVVMPTYPHDAKGLLTAAIEDDNPVIFIEHRWCHYVTGHVPVGYYHEPLSGPKLVHPGHDVTIVASSYMTLEAVRAAEALKAIGCSVAVIDMRVLRPLNLAPVLDSVEKTGHLITVDTGWRQFGIGAEIVAEVVDRRFSSLRAAPVRLGMPDHPTPSSRGLIPNVYPDAERIARAVGTMLDIVPERVESAVADLHEKRSQLPIDIPDPFFKGPF